MYELWRRPLAVCYFYTENSLILTLRLSAFGRLGNMNNSLTTTKPVLSTRTYTTQTRVQQKCITHTGINLTRLRFPPIFIRLIESTILYVANICFRFYFTLTFTHRRSSVQGELRRLGPSKISLYYYYFYVFILY